MQPETNIYSTQVKTESGNNEINFFEPPQNEGGNKNIVIPFVEVLQASVTSR